ncbi:hypothetical protein [Vreelandella populi]|uniref:hypothetical protein n=1 Tax=Vreelandella populi TaxID=2498858 RepID=UPI000FB1F689|nr:hypothetical protein [Halomonas populi]RUR52712.1 hypothetical protein ELY40_11720 [Halomonas populi]
MASGWAHENKKRTEHREFYLKRLSEQQETIEYVQQVNVGLMAANAIIIGGWQYEASKAGDFEHRMHQANGRLGPMQRRINDLESSVERMRNSWTSEVEAGR